MLVHLEAREFRNLEPLSLTLRGGTHLIMGPNGAGKTNFLEGIYLLATTRSFRTAQIADCCRHGTSRFALLGEVEGAQRLRLELRWQDGQRHRALNGRQAPLADHLAAQPVVCWTAAEAEILTGPPAARRRFLDRGVISQSPSAISIITRYRQALDEKRRLLAAEGEELETWNRVLAAAAAELIRLRAEYAAHLGEALTETLAECRLGIPEIDLNYRSSPPNGADGAEAIYEALAAAAGRERLLRQPLVGPHRDDLIIRWQGHEVRRVASAGERKALGLALLAAHGGLIRSSSPIYLLDDADTELDAARLRALWRIFGAAGQLLTTSNRPLVWDGIDVAHRWQCESGRLKLVE